MAARHEEGCYERSILKHFHACKGLSNDGVGGVVRGNVFQEIRPGCVGFKNRRFREKKSREGYRRTTRGGAQPDMYVLRAVLA